MTTYTLTRERYEDGQTKAWEGLALREVGQMVAFCAHDNLGYTRAQACRLGNELEQMVRGMETRYALNAPGNRPAYLFRVVPE
jgi:hypothetical protein